MNAYYDTGIILKLYTQEQGSKAIRAFVVGRKKPVYLSPLHIAECGSALRLKQFRGESAPGQVAQALAHIEEDFDAGVLNPLPIDWDRAWQRCRALSDAYAGITGCRTLDTLHVACAVLVSAGEFITSDHRQIALGQSAGLRVVNPLACYR